MGPHFFPLISTHWNTWTFYRANQRQQRIVSRTETHSMRPRYPHRCYSGCNHHRPGFARLLIGYIIFISGNGRTASEALGVVNEDSECCPHLTVKSRHLSNSFHSDEVMAGSLSILLHELERSRRIYEFG
jgi:hypothetical protein